MNSNNDVYYNNLGETYFSLKSYVDAMMAFEIAIQNNQTNDVYYKNLGETYFNLKRFEEAIPLFLKAIEINPNNPDAYFFKAKALVN